MGGGSSKQEVKANPQATMQANGKSQAEIAIEKKRLETQNELERAKAQRDGLQRKENEIAQMQEE